MAVRKFVAWFKQTSRNIDEHDGRVIRVGAAVTELTDYEKSTIAENQRKTNTAIHYLTARNKYVLNCTGFKYVPAESTDIKTTMRDYIEQTMPDVKTAYPFLF